MMIIAPNRRYSQDAPQYVPLANTYLPEQRVSRPDLTLNLMIDENYQIWTATGQNLRE